MHTISSDNTAAGGDSCVPTPSTAATFQFDRKIGSVWGVDMRGTFHRNATEALMDEEVSRFCIRDLPWEGNLLIKQAEDFMQTWMRESMIQDWVNKTNILRLPDGPAGKYEWTAKSKAPNPLQRKTWAEPLDMEADETFEARIADFLNQVTDLSILFKKNPLDDEKLKPRRKWKAFNRSKIENNRNPDVVLVSPGADPVKWADVVATIEVKWMDRPDLLQKAIGQLGDLAALVFHHQPDRQWFPCLSLCGTSLRMSVFTRGGSFHTVPLDLCKDVALFTKVMNYFTQAELNWLGYDIHIFRLYGYQLWDPDSVPSENYQVIGKLFLSTGLYGKGTRVFAVKDDMDKHAVIKDCWDPSDTISDHLIHEKLRDPSRDPNQKIEGGQVGVPPPEDHSEKNFAEQNDDHCSRATIDPWDPAILLRGITIMERSMQPLDRLSKYSGTSSPPSESIRSIAATMGYVWDTPDQPRLDDRHRHRTLFKTCGVDILWFGTVREMFHAVAGAVTGHRNAYEKRQILHGDVSDGNTLMLVNHIGEDTAVPSPPENPSPRWTPLRHGMASDWGSAVDCQEQGEKKFIGRTGTLPFESNESLMGKALEYHHDLQSYFWLIFLITCNCAGPFNTRRDWNKEIEEEKSGRPITTTLVSTYAAIKTQGGDWKQVAEDRVQTPDSTSSSPSKSVPLEVNYDLTWVRPGVHALTPESILAQRRRMNDQELINLMTPYFARHKAVRDGIVKLYTLFFGCREESEDGFFRRNPPTQPVTYDRMLSILRDIRDGIDYADDPYPDAQFRRNARERYCRYLKSGNRMPLMAEEDEEETNVTSDKRMAYTSLPEGEARGSKRGRAAGPSTARRRKAAGRRGAGTTGTARGKAK